MDRGKEAGKVKKSDRRKNRSGKPNDRVNQRKNFQEENFKDGRKASRREVREDADFTVSLRIRIR